MPLLSARPKALTGDLAPAIHARPHAGQSVKAICEDPANPCAATYRWRAAGLAFGQNRQALLAAQVGPERRQPRKGLVSYTPEFALMAPRHLEECPKCADTPPPRPRRWRRYVSG